MIVQIRPRAAHNRWLEGYLISGCDGSSPGYHQATLPPPSGCTKQDQRQSLPRNCALSIVLMDSIPSYLHHPITGPLHFPDTGFRSHTTWNLVEQFSLRDGKIRRRCQLVSKGLSGDCGQARASIRALHEIAGGIELGLEAMKPKTTASGKYRTAAIGAMKGQRSVSLSKASPSNSIYKLAL